MDREVLRAEDIVKILDVSKNKAYNIIHSLNNELKKKGYIVIRGRVNKQYFYNRLNLN